MVKLLKSYMSSNMLTIASLLGGLNFVHTELALSLSLDACLGNPFWKDYSVKHFEVTVSCI